jgi:hypothetical protein
MQQRLVFAPIFDLFCGIIYLSSVCFFVHTKRLALLFWCVYWRIVQQRRKKINKLWSKYFKLPNPHHHRH